MADWAWGPGQDWAFEGDSRRGGEVVTMDRVGAQAPWAHGAVGVEGMWLGPGQALGL